MAVAKRRQSKARKNSRRAQWMKSVSPPSLSKCAHCGEYKLSHTACPACGKYGKASEPRVVIPQKEEKAESKTA